MIRQQHQRPSQDVFRGRRSPGEGHPAMQSYANVLR